MNVNDYQTIIKMSTHFSLLLSVEVIVLLYTPAFRCPKYFLHLPGSLTQGLFFLSNRYLPGNPNKYKFKITESSFLGIYHTNFVNLIGQQTYPTIPTRYSYRKLMSKHSKYMCAYSHQSRIHKSCKFIQSLTFKSKISLSNQNPISRNVHLFVVFLIHMSIAKKLYVFLRCHFAWFFIS